MTKEKERDELHRAIWQIANNLRGSVDGWDLKSYVLDMLFYRFISKNLCNHINQFEREAGNKDFDYATIEDDEAEFGRADTVSEKGFYILPSALLHNVQKKAKSNPDLNETLREVFKNIEPSAKGKGKISGTAFAKILPPVSRFTPMGDGMKKKEIVLETLNAYFERYYDISKGVSYGTR